MMTSNTNKKAAGGYPMAIDEVQEKERPTTNRMLIQHPEKSNYFDNSWETVSWEWENSEPANPEHQYLKNKGVKPFGEIRQYKDILLIPMYDCENKLKNIQRIFSNGQKLFPADRSTKGLYYKIGFPNISIFPPPELPEKIYITEGYATGATIYMATNKPTVIAFSAGNLESVAESINYEYREAEIIFCADNNNYNKNGKNTGVEKATDAALLINARIVVPDFTGLDISDEPTDFNDLMKLSGLDEVRKQIEKNIKLLAKSVNDTNLLKTITVHELLSREFKPKELILSPWLATQSLCMIHAFRGIGKTYLALYIAYAIASGSEIFYWKADKPRKVLYLDGEMPAYSLKERLVQIVLAVEKEAMPNNLIFVTPDIQEIGIPDLATTEGQNRVNSLITNDTDLIIVDNLSAFIRTGKENEAESWQPIQSWALGLRAMGKSVLFIHHSNKAGFQRGTSRKEDVLDVVIALKRPVGYTADKGALFEVHFEKARHLYGEEVASFEAQLVNDENYKQIWAVKFLEESTFDKVVECHKKGLEPKEIAEQLKIHKSTVSRHLKEAKESGRI